MRAQALSSVGSGSSESSDTLRRRSSSGGAKVERSILRSPGIPSRTRTLTPEPTTTSPQRRPIVPIRIGISNAPTAIPPITALSIAPNTRDITASGVTRCRIVYALTSTTEFASPSMIITATAAPTVGHAATRSNGAAQKSTPMPKFRASRPRCASRSATNPPMNPPIPSIAFR